MVLRIMASTYPESVSLAHFNMFVSPIHTEGENTLSEHEKRMMKRGEETRNTGIGYFMLQSTKVRTLALKSKSITRNGLTLPSLLLLVTPSALRRLLCWHT